MHQRLAEKSLLWVCSSLYIVLCGAVNDHFIVCWMLPQCSRARWCLWVSAKRFLAVVGCSPFCETLNAKCRLENFGLVDESDDETICYSGSGGSDESIKLSSDELSSQRVRMNLKCDFDALVLCAIDLRNLLIVPPRFSFSVQLGLQVSLTDCNYLLDHVICCQ